ncbi:uncharacterized protein LOC105184434 isoform X2 [Harpegnathos saltator]|uniref:uncharacterized protein LOC105184434 isoform X2 n=1 Tax=Harpegnathos saltator TaxID=610380 RepID=UPI0005915A3C|nr:uncharacterized protein LOC105184434 isoform X2 [Harpegnathos saltator]
MTRKCALCKETNYKNNYSFFSAPKDPEIRKKWQVALGIENYPITDDIYVCSRHFHKNDIITHWVSGVPPQVIKIKYKKCRLRPGAVPGKHFYLDNSSQSINKDALNKNEVDMNDFLIFRGKKDIDSLKDEKTFLIPRKKKHVNGNEHMDNRNESNIKNTNINKEESQILNKPLHTDALSKTVENSVKKNDSFKKHKSEKTPLKIWKPNGVSMDSEKSVNHDIEMTDLYINNQVLATLNYDNLCIQNKIEYNVNKNEILFEDFLDVYTEVSVPRGWSCLVTSKGHSTTVVYLCMGITKNGLPFVEKQVFIRSDMILHCAAVNREIDPIVHNLLKEDKHIKIKSLLDIEELVDEFDRRIICQGICNEKDCEHINIAKVAYKDGIKWRHRLCPLIVNTNLSRCTKCTILFRTLVHKSRESFSIGYDNLFKFRKQKRKSTHAITNPKTYRKMESSI